MSRFLLFICIALACVTNSNSKQLPFLLTGQVAYEGKAEGGKGVLLGDGLAHMAPHFMKGGVDVVSPEKETDFHGEGADKQAEIEQEAVELDASTPLHRRRKRVITTTTWRLWTGGIVPYAITSSVPTEGKVVIQSSMRLIEENTCIKFYDINSQSSEFSVTHQSYLNFIKSSGCWSYIGRAKSGEQDISACKQEKTALHEVLHALGVFHEQSHRDRDNYIHVKYGNIIEGKERNFEKVTESDKLHGTYSADSIMHYESHSASSNGFRTIVPIVDYLSFGDSDKYWNSLREVNTVYNCTAGCDLSCHNDGFPIVHDTNCVCHCIDGLDPGTQCGDFLSTVHGVFVDLTLETQTAAFELTNPQLGSTYQWIVRSPPGSKIALDFLQLEVAGTREGCTSILTLNPGHPTVTGKVLCGYGYEKTVISEINSIILTLTTNSASDKLQASVRLLQAEKYCYSVKDKGETYNGEVNRAEDNSACLKWTDAIGCDFSPFEMSVLPADYSGNACRNPGRTHARPWCYTGRSLTGCDIKYCDACSFGRVFDTFDDCSDLLAANPGYCSTPEGQHGCRLTCNIPPITVTSAASCEPPNPIAGSSIIEDLASSYEIGSKVTYKCDSSSYTRPRYCLSTGQWSALNTVCSGRLEDSNPDCVSLSTGTTYCQTEDGQRNCGLTCHLATTCAVPTPPSENHVEVLTGQSGLTVGGTAVFRCSDDYVVLSGDTRRVCNSDGTLSGTMLRCGDGTLRTEVSCVVPVPAPEDNVVHSSPSEIPVNTGVLYTCKEGHTLQSGNVMRLCSEGGSLLGHQPKCAPIQCDVPVPSSCDNVETQSGSKVAYNVEVTYTCLPGHALLVGDLSRLCTDGAVLTGRAPRCEKIRCNVPLPSPVSNVVRESPSLVEGGTQAYYSCLQGFTLTNGDLERMCSSDGSLLGNPPICTETKCVVPQPLEADNTQRVSAAEVSIGSYAVYECTVGHVVSGQLRMECQSDGNLGGSLPKCLGGVCSVRSPSTDQHAQVVSGTQVPLATDAVYRCDLGYTLQSGNLVRGCQKGGALSGQEPQCVRIRVCEDRRDDCSPVLNAVPDMCSAFINYSRDCPATCGNCNYNDITCPVPTPSSGDNAVLLNTTTEMSPGQVAVYSCDVNNYLVSGNLNRACRLDGTLTGSQPSCSDKSATTSWVNTMPTIPLQQQTPNIPFVFFGASEYSTIQQSGAVKCWRTYCLKSGDIRFVVLRRAGTFPAHSYTVVGHNNVRCRDDRAMTWCIPAQEQIHVNAGDILGMVDLVGGNIGYMGCFTAKTGDNYGEYNGYSAATNMVAGHTFNAVTGYQMCAFVGVNAQIGPPGQ
ncbi:uncharacterized protein LOC124151721 [Haliotis rufescens]|uniref:uncharacterized protein LOC124151721 n=1 Tax=Haliotis rufescens TaxID=6454 RepID=UPI00201F5F4F|nr:uncharacterized protein LOC124151721 [Haliotis rufescens]